MAFSKSSIFSLSILALLSLWSATVVGQDLSPHLWKNRVLLIKSSTEISDIYEKQLHVFNDSIEGLKERKLVMYQLIGDKYKYTDFQNSDNKATWKPNTKTLDSYLESKDTFRVTLMGLDGGIKLEQNALLTIKQLFDLIDSMPMRRLELRK